MEIMKVKAIQPIFDNVLTTLDVYEDDVYEDGIIIKYKGNPKWEQKVIKAGPNTPFKEGMIVHINPIRYAKMKHKEGTLKDGVISDNPIIEYKLPIIEIGNDLGLLLQSNDIDYIITDYEMVKVEKPKNNKLILPGKKKIIV